MSSPVHGGRPDLREAARRNTRSHGLQVLHAAKTLWRVLWVSALVGGALYALAYWLSWRLDLGWF